MPSVSASAAPPASSIAAAAGAPHTHTHTHSEQCWPRASPRVWRKAPGQPASTVALQLGPPLAERRSGSSSSSSSSSYSSYSSSGSHHSQHQHHHHHQQLLHGGRSGHRTRMLAFVVLVSLVAAAGVWVLGSPQRMRQTAERVRLAIDQLSCTEYSADIYPARLQPLLRSAGMSSSVAAADTTMAAQAEGQPPAAAAAAGGPVPAAGSASSALLQQRRRLLAEMRRLRRGLEQGNLDEGLSCQGTQGELAQLARTLPQPRIYVAQREAAAAFAPPAQGGCTQGYMEDDLNALLLSNVTGTLVATPEAADVVWIPFGSTCKDNTADDVSGQLFERVWEAVQPLHTQFATLCARPWMERTNFGMETRDFLKRYPRVTLFSPELKNVHMRELHPTPRDTFQRHVVVPQLPLDVRVFETPTRADWERPYTFCFRGTQVTQQRTTLAKAMRVRNDSFVDANCRRTRQEATTTMKTGGAVDLYARCKFCPVPKGDSLSDRRFFDAMRSGCIPVVFERLKPLPFALWLDYVSWAVLMEDHSSGGMRRSLDHLADMSQTEWRARQQRMLATTRALSISACQGHSGLLYMLASLGPARTPEHALDDMRGFTVAALA